MRAIVVDEMGEITGVLRDVTTPAPAPLSHLDLLGLDVSRKGEAVATVACQTFELDSVDMMRNVAVYRRVRLGISTDR